MAKKLESKAGATYLPQDAAPKKKEGRDAWTQRMLTRAQETFTFDTEQRRRVLEDMKFAFVAGHQWDRHLAGKRRNKPNYEFNRIRQLIRRVTGQQLKNKPQIKVRAVEEADVDTADIYNGLIKNIEVQSSAENAYDTAFQWACGGGYGVLRVVADYEGPDSFDQCLRIVNVMDPLTVWFDPAARKFDRSDARFVFVTELITKEEFKDRWPGKETIDFDVPSSLDEYDKEWFFKDMVRIAEYWYVEKEVKTIYLLSDGAIVDKEDWEPVRDEWANPPIDPQTGQPAHPPITVKSEREVETDCVYSSLVYGKGALEEPTKWAGSMIPIVPQWGDLISINGEQIYSGMTRFGRDAQAIHNFELSTMVEVVAKLPNSPLTATTKMIEGLESYYERMGYDDAPVLLYNVDPNAPTAKPTREPPPVLPVALANLSAIATEELKADLGVYDASIGAKSNESSGRAILARQSEGEIANFVYVDNQVKALKRLGEVLVDAIPHYYDAERSIRILGEDNAEKYVSINKPMLDQQTGEVIIENDLSRGRFDVTVTVGKSYDTARMELAEAAQALSAQPGPFGMLASYMLIKSIDIPGSEEFVEAARRALVQIGLLEPGDDEQPPAPPPPDPKLVAETELKQAQTEKTRAETAQIFAETPAAVEKTQAETVRTQADAIRSAAQAGQATGGFELPPGFTAPFPGSAQ
ncbi:portal protein [Pseudoxanthomonas sp.]|uniref:portal protein n=1 Tax=Pseudoxanthomonas sp. TaxID=1871049 RepID=UPI003F80952E